MDFVFHQISRRPRLNAALTIWSLFSIWESFSVFNLQQRLSHLQAGSLGYFVIYNTGDLNNSFGLGIILYAFFRWIKLERLPSLVTSSLLTLWAFLTIEWNDPMDIPFALVGLVLFSWAFSQKPRDV